MPRDSIFILGDQLFAGHRLLADAQPAECVIVLIESLSRMRARRSHKQKVVLVLWEFPAAV
jgi:deoxyribodipyrimidine photolyase-like uncharacterized protein